MNGSELGTNGTATIRACAAAALVAFLVCTVNALSILHDAVRARHDTAEWQPWVMEYSSLTGLVSALTIAVATEGFIASTSSLKLRAAVLLLGSALFSALHVAVMVGLREAWWWLAGADYPFNLGRDWLYEYRKDAIAFGIMVALLAFVRPPRVTDLTDANPTEGANHFVTLQDGRRQVLINAINLRAVCGRGNYVELIFADGRHRLLRATLAATRTTLGDRGFRQTHRSWLVFLGGIQAMERTASGDFRLLLADGLEVPLSRRYQLVLKEVMRQLSSCRGPGGPGP